MRNTLILSGQIRDNEKDGLAPLDAVGKATVKRARPVILTALAAMLAFIPLTHSVFWGTLAYTLIGGTFAVMILTLVFLPALYAIWFKIRPTAGDGKAVARQRVDLAPQQRAAAAGLVLDDRVDARALALEHQRLVARRDVGLAARRERLPVVHVLLGAGLRRGCGGGRSGGSGRSGLFGL